MVWLYNRIERCRHTFFVACDGHTDVGEVAQRQGKPQWRQQGVALRYA